jgi:hypothetical protein
MRAQGCDGGTYTVSQVKAKRRTGFPIPFGYWGAALGIHPA